GNSNALPTTSLQATNGGYVSVAEIGSGSTPSVAALLAAITSKGSFSGTIGLDTSESIAHPHIYTDTIDLTGFTNGQVRIGSATSAILTGTITPVAQRYDFGGYAGQGGALVVQSALTGVATGVDVTSPTASGGAPRHGLVLLLQGNNSFGGNVAVSYSSVVLDSANALPSGSNFSLGSYAYMGFTEQTGYTFASFANHLLPGYAATGILGIDSHDSIDGFVNGGTGTSVHTINDAVDLSGFTSPLFVGTQTAATIGSGATVRAPTDGVLRLVNLGENGTFTIDAALLSGNVTSVVSGMSGSRGAVVLTNGTNSYGGGTTLQGGTLLVGHDSALGGGALTTGASNGDTLVLGGATSGRTIGNNIILTDNLNIGTGTVNQSNNTLFNVDPNSITLNGVISDLDASHHGRLYLTTQTTLNGASTYSGGTYVEANTNVGNASALGSGFVDMAYGAILGLNTNLGIGLLSDANNFLGGAGTGSIALGSNTLTITQSSGSTFTGGISGTGGIVKAGTGSLALFGTSSYSGGTTINGGFLVVSNNANLGNASGGVTFASGASTPILQFNASLGTVSRAFAFNAAGTIQTNTGTSISTTLSGAFSGSGNFTKQGGGRLALTGSGTGFSGGITIAGGTLVVDGNFSSAGATFVNNSSKLYGAGSLGAITVASGSFLGGASVAGGPESLDATGISFLNGSKMDVFLTNMTAGGQGTGWSLLNVSGALNFNGSPVTIDLFTVNGSGSAATATFFDPAVSSQYLLASAGSITGFTSASINTIGFTNSFSGGAFSASAVGNNLYLNYTAAIPEPATFAALVGLAGLGLVALRRRRIARA
ncbi:MAG: autotransporter, partial [Lacunisphaera sp.]|nr:autotransporter [Lacunisphaera sp.]